MARPGEIGAVAAAVEQQGREGTRPDGITSGVMPCVGLRIQCFA